MNYRHIYHAGNVNDIFKHVVLTMLIGRLRDKEKGFSVLDTHAGIGFYDLEDPRAKKTNEAGEWINRFMAAEPIPELADFYRVIHELNPQSESVRYYPGSPFVSRRLMRLQDRLMACELHPEDVLELRYRFRNDKQTQIHFRNGYEALNALLPPEEKRGLVLIDPPFERTDEFDLLVDAVKLINQRWPQGQVAIWYPIKERPAIWRFHEALVASDIPKISYAEFLTFEETRHDRLNGSGFIFVNAPWQFDETLKSVLPALHKAMHTEFQGSVVKDISE